MLKIGFIQLLDSIVRPYGLSKFFNEQNVDWRFAYWPNHISDDLRGIHLRNLGKSLWYNKYSSRYKDVAWNEYNKEGDPIISEVQVDKDSWHFYSHMGETLEYIDYHEIRTINEPWVPCPVNKRVSFITEWVHDCDFILLDITDCMNKPPERIVEAINGLLSKLKECNMKVFIFDYEQSYEFLGMNNRRLWQNYLIEIEEKCPFVYVSPLDIISQAEKRGVDSTGPRGIRNVMDFLSKYYHENLLGIFLDEITDIKSG